MWHYERQGSFSVKSCYVMGAKKRFRIEGSNKNLKKWWNGLWNLGIPPKIKHLIWRLFHNVIPTTSNLMKRKVTDDPTCFRCRRDYETPIHALFRCLIIKQSLVKLGCWDQVKLWSRGTFASVTQSNFSLYCMLLWCI